MGVGPGAVAGAGVVLAAGVFADQAGEARNDIPATFFLLAAAAILANAMSSRTQAHLPVATTPLALAGVAAGLALGTKLNLAAPVVALTVGVVVAAPAGRRLAASGTWIAAVVAGGGFWFARNLAHVGNPVPWVSSIGPVPLPGPTDYIGATREPHALIRYVTDTGVWSDWLFPALNDRFGALWPVVLLLALIGAVLALVRGRSAVEQVLGWSALAAAAVYPFTPLSASGPDGMPVGFASNLRYVAPVVALSLALLPIGVAVLDRRWRTAVLVALLAVGAVALVGSDDFVPIASGRAAAVGVSRPRRCSAACGTRSIAASRRRPFSPPRSGSCSSPSGPGTRPSEPTSTAATPAPPAATTRTPPSCGRATSATRRSEL